MTHNKYGAGPPANVFAHYETKLAAARAEVARWERLLLGARVARGDYGPDADLCLSCQAHDPGCNVCGGSGVVGAPAAEGTRGQGDW